MIVRMLQKKVISIAEKPTCMFIKIPVSKAGETSGQSYGSCYHKNGNNANGSCFFFFGCVGNFMYDSVTLEHSQKRDCRQSREIRGAR